MGLGVGQLCQLCQKCTYVHMEYLCLKQIQPRRGLAASEVLDVKSELLNAVVSLHV